MGRIDVEKNDWIKGCRRERKKEMVKNEVKNEGEGREAEKERELDCIVELCGGVWPCGYAIVQESLKVGIGKG